MNRSVLIDHPVVATTGPAFGLMPVVKVFDGNLLTDLRRGAVDNDPSDILHRVHWFHNEHELDEFDESGQGRGATLYGEGTGHGSEDSGKEFGDFENSIPVDSLHD